MAFPVRRIAVFSSYRMPGSGKTALASRLAQFSSAEEAPSDNCESFTPEFLTAIYFCSARDTSWVDPLTFTHTVASQLLRNLKGEQGD